MVSGCSVFILSRQLSVADGFPADADVHLNSEATESRLARVVGRKPQASCPEEPRTHPPGPRRSAREPVHHPSMECLDGRSAKTRVPVLPRRFVFCALVGKPSWASMFIKF